MERPELTLLVAVLTLIGSASFIGEMTYTGNILDDKACGPLGCVEMCDSQDDCVAGLACCPSSWGTGFCDKAENCATIATFTRTHSIDASPSAEAVVSERRDAAAYMILISMLTISIVFIILWFIYRIPTGHMRHSGNIP